MLSGAFLESLYKIITNTIDTANEKMKITDQIASFLRHHNLAPCKFASQVPTCLVLTNSETNTNIDKQFQILSTDLDHKIQAKSIVLDEKKCGNIKSTMKELISQIKTLKFDEKVVEEEKMSDINENDALAFRWQGLETRYK